MIHVGEGNAILSGDGDVAVAPSLCLQRYEGGRRRTREKQREIRHSSLVWSSVFCEVH